MPKSPTKSPLMLASSRPFERTPLPRVGEPGAFLYGVELDREPVPFDEYPFSLPVVRNLRQLSFHPKVTFLVGENGTGKSTLLKAIALKYGFNAEGGPKNPDYDDRETNFPLADYLRLQRGGSRANDGYFLRAETFYNVAAEVDDRRPGGYGRRLLHEQSHGEAFFALFMHRFWGEGLYLLDEPEAALSPMRQMAMLTRMHALVRGGSQFIVATHSPILMAYPNALILLCSEDGIAPTTYEETEHVYVTREFLNNRERMLKVLLDERGFLGGEEETG